MCIDNTGLGVSRLRFWEELYNAGNGCSECC